MSGQGTGRAATGMPPLIHPEWPQPSGVRAVCTTRLGGASAPPFDGFNLGAHCGDDPAAVAHNRALLRDAAGLPAEPCWLHQVHGTRVPEVGAAGLPSKNAPEADGAWTAEVDVVCVVMAADCLPVLLARRDGRAVAAVHAGWRGLAAGVLQAALAALPGAPEDYLAWLGPRISPKHFLVHEDVRSAFCEQGDASAFAAASAKTADQRWAADLGRLARLRLQERGVVVFDSGLCTVDDARRFFSHRRDGRCGRMAAMIWRTGHVAV